MLTEGLIYNIIYMSANTPKVVMNFVYRPLCVKGAKLIDTRQKSKFEKRNYLFLSFITRSMTLSASRFAMLSRLS